MIKKVLSLLSISFGVLYLMYYSTVYAALPKPPTAEQIKASLRYRSDAQNNISLDGAVIKNAPNTIEIQTRNKQILSVSPDKKMQLINKENKNITQEEIKTGDHIALQLIVQNNKQQFSFIAKKIKDLSQ